MKPVPISPAPGQESVWNYPRPPRIELTDRHVQVLFNGVTIADSHNCVRVLETSHPPMYYIPLTDVQLYYLSPSLQRTVCEWKGTARYYDLRVDDRAVENAAWTYPAPRRGYEPLAEYLAFYPALMDACLVDGEKVQPQPGFFYGGWITADIVGPFKGEAGSQSW